MSQEKMEMFQVGSRVRCVKENTYTGIWTPRKGICGTVVNKDDEDLKVQWDEDTRDGAWWCHLDFVAPSNV